MNWGVRIALLTSDHFWASVELKVRFSTAPGLDPWHGVPGAIQAPLRAINLTPSSACRNLSSRFAVATAANPCRLLFRAAPGKLLLPAVHLG